jgi:alpha-L-fucosidase
VPQLEVKEYMSDYPIKGLVDTPPAGNARVDAFFTARNNIVYAILPRRPVREVTLDGIPGSGAVKVTLLENGAALESTREGKKVRVRVPEALSAALPAREAYVLKIV